MKSFEVDDDGQSGGAGRGHVPSMRLKTASTSTSTSVKHPVNQQKNYYTTTLRHLLKVSNPWWDNMLRETVGRVPLSYTVTKLYVPLLLIKIQGCIISCREVQVTTAGAERHLRSSLHAVNLSASCTCHPRP